MRFLIAAVSIAISAWGLGVLQDASDPQSGGGGALLVAARTGVLGIAGAGLILGLAWTILFVLDPRRAGDLVPTIRNAHTGAVAVAMCIAGCVGVAAALVLPSLGWPVQLLVLLDVVGIVMTWSASILVAAWEPRPAD